MNRTSVHARPSPRLLHVLDSYEGCLQFRAGIESYRAWRRRRPWCWLPLRPWADMVRVTAFRRFGRRWAEAFARAWKREFERRAEFTGETLRSALVQLLVGTSERARRHAIDVLEVELPRAARLAAQLNALDDELCAAVTVAVLGEGTAAVARAATLNRLEGEARERSRREGWAKPEGWTDWPRWPAPGANEMSTSRRN